MLAKECAICESSSYSVLYDQNANLDSLDGTTFSARRQPDRWHYRIVRCSTCGLLFSNPILKERQLEKLYEQSDLTYTAQLSDLSATYGNYLRRYLPQTPEKERLLEIGCGNGFFLEVALDLGFKTVYGVEPSRRAVKMASPRVKGFIRNEMFDPESFAKASFDVICSFHTIDHLLDPNAFLSGCRTLLRKEGIVLCICHDVESLAAKLLGERCPIIDVEHIYMFSKRTLRMIFEKNGLHVTDVFDVSNCFSLAYWLQMFPLPLPLKQFGTKLIKIAGVDRLKIELKAGNIGVVAEV